MAAKKNEIIEIKPIEMETVTVRIVGTSPLIMHKWSEKAKKMIQILVQKEWLLLKSQIFQKDINLK